MYAVMSQLISHRHEKVLLKFYWSLPHTRVAHLFLTSTSNVMQWLYLTHQLGPRSASYDNVHIMACINYIIILLFYSIQSLLAHLYFSISLEFTRQKNVDLSYLIGLMKNISQEV